MNCSSCHQPHASNVNALLLAPERYLCTSCHTNIGLLTTLSVQHAPFEDGPCTSCHTPHGSKYEPLLINPMPNLCYSCHPKLATLMSRPSHHPNKCTRCHGVHAAEHDFLLFADLNSNFCYSCHPTIEATYASSSHKNLSCLKCHKAHGSKYTPLLARNAPQVCTRCHDEHKYVGNGVMFLLKEPPTLTSTWGPTRNAHRATPKFFDRHANKPLTCTSSCHAPHGSQYQHMMKNYKPNVDGQCLQCHSQVGKQF
jgi:predicted CXXCH cytochrome family protein